MRIYIDLIMILNFFIDFILLLTVSVILRRNVKLTRVMMSAFIGGLSILILFFDITSILLMFLKFLISILMIITCFGYKNIKYTIINLLYLYLTSIVLGGFLYLVNLQISYKHIGILFFNNGLSFNFIFLLVFSPIILYLYSIQLKKLKTNYSNYYNVEIYFKGKKYKYIGYLDTGNILKDSLTGKNVILIDKRKLLFNIKEFRIIPYMGLNGTNMIKVIKIDKLIINDKEYDVLLGIMDSIRIDGVDIILNRNILEG